MLLHSRKIGMTQFGRILATGGASKNTEILQVMSNVFGVPIFTSSQPNSASLGAAYRAIHGHSLKHDANSQFDDVVGKSSAAHLEKVADPDHRAHHVYEELLKRYSKCEK